MKLGIPGWAGSGPFPLRVVEAIVLGADYVEFSLDYPWPDAIKKEEISRTIKIARKRGLRFAFHSPIEGIDLASPRPKIRKAAVETIKENIRFAKRFEPLYYNIHPTTSLPTTFAVVEGVADVVLASFVLSLSELSKFAKKEKVQLLVENTPEPLFGQPEYIELFLKVPNIGLCFDVAHAELLKGEMDKLGLKGRSIEWWTKKFAKQISVCHLQDVRGSRDHLILGKGSGNWKKWLKLLKKTKIENLLLETQFVAEGEQASLEDFHEEIGLVRRIID